MFNNVKGMRMMITGSKLERQAVESVLKLRGLEFKKTNQLDVSDMNDAGCTELTMYVYIGDGDDETALAVATQGARLQVSE